MYCLMLFSLAFLYISYFESILKFEKAANFRKRLLFSLPVTVVLGIGAQLIADTFLVIPVAYLFSLIIIILLYKEKTGNKIAYFLQVFISISIAECIFSNIFSALDIEDPLNYILTILSLCGVLWISYFIFTKKLSKNAFSIPKKLFIPVILIETIIMLMTTLSLTLSQLHEDFDQFGSLLISAGSFIIVVSMYIMLYYINTNIGYKLQIDGLNEYIEQQKSYYQLLLSKEEQTRKFRHELSNNLLQLQYYLDNKEITDAQNKISSMLHDIDIIKKQNYSVGIEIVDVIINYYLVLVRNDVDIQIEASAHPDHNLPISDSDLCIIIGNLVKNAVEATMHLPKGQRSIKIISKIGKRNIHFVIENSYDTELDKAISKGTSKENKADHGFGLQTVQELVNKNNGQYICKRNNGVYVSDVLFTI